MKKLTMLVAVLAATAFAEESDDGVLAKSGFELGGSVGYTGLRIVKSSAIPNIETDQPFLNHVWQQWISGGITVSKRIGRSFNLATGIGGHVNADVQGANVNWQEVRRNSGAYVNVASADFTFGSLPRPVVQLKAGYFSYSYASTGDFGGYLYTAGLYPMYLTSSGGSARIAGILARVQYPSILFHDIIVDLETRREPYMDISAGYVSTLKLHDGAAEIGAGVKGCRIVPAANEEQYPHLIYTTYTTQEFDSLRINADSSGYDSVYREATMPFKGVKLMARAQIDFRKLFKLEGDFWGANDLRLYGEAAVLGVKSYPANSEGRGYTDIRDRVPVMAGLTMPTYPAIGNGMFPAALSLFLIGIEADSLHISPIYSGGAISGYDTTRAVRGFSYKPWRPYVFVGASLACGALTTILERKLGRHMRLDNITVEVERCSSPYNDNHSALSALPAFVFTYDQKAGERVGTKPWHEDDWRWAVMADKKLFKRLTLNAKLASGHMTVRDPQGFWTRIERLFAYYEWYWQMGFNVSF